MDLASLISKYDRRVPRYTSYPTAPHFNCAFLFLEAAPEKIVSFFGISLAVKTSASPRTLTRPVRAEIATLDPDLAVFNLDTMREHVDKSLLLPRISATLLGVFGAVGLTLAAIGLLSLIVGRTRRRP